MTTTQWTVAVLACTGLLAILAGCNKTSSTGEELASADTGPHAAGKKVFAANCARCHSMSGATAAGGGPPGAGVPNAGDAPQPGRPPGAGGPPGGMGGGMMGRGPDLLHAGRDPNHTVDWLMAFIRDPKSKKPESRMPPLNRLSEDDLRAVAEYLASLK